MAIDELARRHVKKVASEGRETLALTEALEIRILALEGLYGLCKHTSRRWDGSPRQADD